MNIEMDMYDISTFIKGLGYDNCDLIADYIDECCCDGWNVKQWLANTDYLCFSDEEEALEYIEENGYDKEDCNIYNSKYYGCMVIL